MADAIPQNGVISAADVLTKLAPIFIGSGTTTGSETSSSGSDGIAALQNIITEAMGSVNDPAQVQAIISNIMTQAAQTFAPVLAQQNSSGLYNSSTLSMLAAMASGQATAQSAQAVTNFKTSQEQIAATAAGKLADATRTTTQTKATGPSLDPMSTLLTVGGGVAASKAFGAINASAPVQAAKNAVTNFFGGETDGQVADRIGSADTAISQVKGIDAGSLTALPETVADAGVEGGVGAATAGALDDITASAVGAASTDIGSGAIADLAGGIGENVGESVAADAGSDIATTAVADTATSVGEDAGGGIIDDVARSWIVCTEFVKQGRMNKRYYIVGSKEFANYWEYGKRGYYLWAIPAVRHLRKHPDSYLSKFLSVTFNKRIAHIAACANIRGAHWTVSGAIVTHALWYLCAFLAITVCPFLSKPDWLALYNEEKA